ncbi:GNAT family N-acetyltransferase [Lacticaseibacillus porcinae]|uniref:GNAT family N-acetyltransferase n=1 Tax=Lacticaseibacillus porcinae TaxID=1123687 RepID=UPI000F7955C8|nr:GNAT family N-acetyltransferase [Lacticaseibacillus porcinae]
MPITIVRVTKATAQDLLLPNQPFQRFGHVQVTRDENGWHHQETLDPTITTQTFPEENYQLEEIDRLGFALAAHVDDKCVGLATFEYQFNKLVYLAVLKVNAEVRHQGIASALLDAAKPIAQQHGCAGMCTIAQGSNLAANRFYLHYGFEIGGLETFRYEFTQAAGEVDIHYWLSF